MSIKLSTIISHLEDVGVDIEKGLQVLSKIAIEVGDLAIAIAPLFPTTPIAPIAGTVVGVSQIINTATTNELNRDTIVGVSAFQANTTNNDISITSK